MKTIRLSVISSLVLLFSLFSLSSKAQDNSFFDQALFRLSGQVYFLSDLKDASRSLTVLTCFGGQSFLGQFMKADLNKYREKEWPKAPEGMGNISQEDIEPFLLFEKLKLSSLGKGKERLTDKELKELSQNCKNLEWDSLGTEEKAILISEVFLRDRFKNGKTLIEALDDYRKSINLKESHEFLSFERSPHLKNEVEKLKNPSPDKDSL